MTYTLRVKFSPAVLKSGTWMGIAWELKVSVYWNVWNANYDTRGERERGRINIRSSATANKISYIGIETICSAYLVCRGSSVSIKSGLRAGRPGFYLIPDSDNDGIFSLCHRDQTGSGAHQASYPVGTRDSFPGGKAAGAWRWPLIPI